MTASLHKWEPDGRPGVPTFDVPLEDTAKIISAMTPATSQLFTPNWQVMGKLTIRLKGGQVVEVYLYRTFDSPGAFSVGWPHQVYYRAGTDAAIEDAIRQAYAHARVSRTK